MTEAVGGYRGVAQVCFDESLERLETAADELEASEQELERRLGLAIVDTVKVAVLCIGDPSRVQTVGCAVATIQHVYTLFDLEQRAAEYERQVEEYQAALTAHLDCLPR